MKVAFATPELQSIVRRTGLAEFAENLPRTLMQQGLEVLVFVPWTIDVEDVRVMGLREVASLRVKDGEGTALVKLHRGHVRDLPVVLVDHALFRERHPYGDERGPYADNWRRYALFARAVLEGTVALGFVPEVIHGFDWSAGLLPLIKQLECGKGHALEKTGTFFGIHNLAMQGTFEREVLPKIGIPLQYFRFTEGIELSARVNFMKAGAEFATLVGASSPTMAVRLTQLNRGDGFEDTFQRRDDELVGIRGGIDYRAWDPSTDPLLAQTYAATQADPTAGKRKCKSTLQDALKLENNPKKPVVAVISRFDTDGGFDVLAEAMTPILEREVELVMMGPGAPEILDRIRTLEQTFAGNCRLIEGYNVNTAHAILGGADALLLPGHYHASTQLCAIALRYGVTPIAYAQSGLEDLVTDITAHPETGTGFLFESYSWESLVEGLDAMRNHYKKIGEWKAAMKRCMELDFSWAECGREYVKAYKRVNRLATGQEKKKRKKPKRHVVTAPEPEPPRPKRIHPNLPTNLEDVDEEEAGQLALVRRLTAGAASEERSKEDKAKDKKSDKGDKSDKSDKKAKAGAGDAAKKDKDGKDLKPTKTAGEKSEKKPSGEKSEKKPSAEKGAEKPADKAAGDKASPEKKAADKKPSEPKVTAKADKKAEPEKKPVAEKAHGEKPKPDKTPAKKAAKKK